VFAGQQSIEMEYETEEQQVEALKEWWAENGKAIVAGVVLGGVAIGGWGWWQSHTEAQAIAASDGFSNTMLAVESSDADTVSSLADTLQDDHGGTLYASYASLAAARVAVENDQLDEAASRLDWVSDNAPNDEVKLIASVRLARILGAQEKAAEGLKRLPKSYSDAFTGLVEEARGDLHLLAGDLDQARSAYEKAQGSENVADPQALSMKLNELATVKDAS